jgi:SAM-dependent methyltransferase
LVYRFSALLSFHEANFYTLCFVCSKALFSNGMKPTSFFKNVSGNYSKHTTKNPLQRLLINQFHDTVVQLIEGTNAHNIFEAGCGEGFSSRHIISTCDCQFVGMDKNFQALLLAKINCPNGVFYQGDIFCLPFIDRSFDLVISLEVLEHLPDPLNALIELCRVSRKWLILSVPHEPFFRYANLFRGKNMRNWGNDPEHINHWTKKSFVNFVGRNCAIQNCILRFPWIILLTRVK